MHDEKKFKPWRHPNKQEMDRKQSGEIGKVSLQHAPAF